MTFLGMICSASDDKLLWNLNRDSCETLKSWHLCVCECVYKFNDLNDDDNQLILMIMTINFNAYGDLLAFTWVWRFVKWLKR